MGRWVETHRIPGRLDPTIGSSLGLGALVADLCLRMCNTGDDTYIQYFVDRGIYLYQDTTYCNVRC